MISHDRSFIDGIANKIVEVANRAIRIYPGNYSEYLEKKGVTGEGEADLRGRAGVRPDAASTQAVAAAANRKIEDTLAVIEQAKTDRQSSRRAQADDRKARTKQRSGLRTRMNELQNEIDALETRLAEIHALQAQPDAYSSGAVTPEIAAEGKRIEQSLPDLLDEWQKVAEEHESLSA